MSGVEERLDKVEERLGSVEKGVNELRGEVQKLRVLGEQNTSDIKLVAEVQARHGEKLEEITKALEPLARIDNFVRLVAHDHEVRIKRLEKHTGI
jgi:uncharacterized coiled-coil protein SlyX